MFDYISSSLDSIGEFEIAGSDLLLPEGPVERIDDSISSSLTADEPHYEYGNFSSSSNIQSQMIDGTDTSTSPDTRDAPSQAKARHPLHMASMHGRVESVKLLLQLRADVHAKGKQGRTAAHHAVLYGHEDVLRLLLCQGSAPATVDTLGNTPLSLAATNGYNRIIMLLIEWGARLN
ncbi:hypothetical protein KCV07_g7970, partial [Aureobasidium melanogenum]